MTSGEIVEGTCWSRRLADDVTCDMLAEIVICDLWTAAMVTCDPWIAAMVTSYDPWIDAITVVRSGGLSEALAPPPPTSLSSTPLASARRKRVRKPVHDPKCTRER